MHLYTSNERHAGFHLYGFSRPANAHQKRQKTKWKQYYPQRESNPETVRCLVRCGTDWATSLFSPVFSLSLFHPLSYLLQPLTSHSHTAPHYPSLLPCPSPHSRCTGFLWSKNKNGNMYRTNAKCTMVFPNWYDCITDLNDTL